MQNQEGSGSIKAEVTINASRRDFDKEEIGECCITDEEIEGCTVLPKQHIHISYTGRPIRQWEYR